MGEQSVRNRAESLLIAKGEQTDQGQEPQWLCFPITTHLFRSLVQLYLGICALFVLMFDPNSDECLRTREAMQRV